MTALDNRQLEIECPNCSKRFKRAAGRLNTAKSLKCPGCSTRIMLNKKGFWVLNKANAVAAGVAKVRGWFSRKS
jgi:DNA-directed RNA polymerase subunit RPC12/RpoP